MFLEDEATKKEIVKYSWIEELFGYNCGIEFRNIKLN